MDDAKKKKAQLIIALGMPKKGMPKDDAGLEDDGGAEADEAGLDSAAEEILKAVQEQDATALKDALKSFWSMCDTD